MHAVVVHFAFKNDNCDPWCKNVFLECVDYVDGKRQGEIGNGDDMRKVV